MDKKELKWGRVLQEATSKLQRILNAPKNLDTIPRPVIVQGITS